MNPSEMSQRALQAELKRRGLKQYAKRKSELVARLQEALDAEESVDDNDGTPAEENVDDDDGTQETNDPAGEIEEGFTE